MLNRIRHIIPEISEAKLEAGSMRLLWVEMVIFSGIYGLLLHSWLGFGGMLLALVMLLKTPKGAVCTIYAISLMWAIIFIGIGYLMAGWFGAVVLPAFVFIKGINVHMSGLRWVQQVAEPRSWGLQGHNLN